MPDPPSKGIFSIFSRGTKPLDREELFGETAGKAAASVATVIPGARMANMHAKGASATNEVSQAHQKFLERGQKLNELEDRTEQMADEAKELAKNSKLLLNKTMNKKWYQL